YDNYVGIADPPEEQYGRTMSIPDELLAEWYRLASGLRGEALEAALSGAREEPYAAKRELAARVVAQYHGDAAAGRAAEHFDLVHRQRGVPENVPEYVLRADDPELGSEGGRVWLPRLMVRVGLAPSTSQAVRLIEQGAVSLDGERVEGREAGVPIAGEHLLQRGKRHFARV